ncbi:MAG: hypothetical protein HONBIEJF_01784 [Fimbriimonadaceae bacterium]|nr:hypothetical protein [Fimbriimonadaceae bacterium]
MELSKADVRRALVRHLFAPADNALAVFERLGSVQFDPIAPVGCNHDLVLHSRVENYRIGDWQKLAYEDRAIYDGWDKQASLVHFDGWPMRRNFHDLHRKHFEHIFDGHADAVQAILDEIWERGPLMPKECSFQVRKEEWKGSWHGPNVAKQTLRALWHTGQVMTSGRKGGHHVYDLSERIVPPHLPAIPKLTVEDFKRELVLERHRAMGIIRPTAPYEVWSYAVYAPARKVAIDALVARGDLVQVQVDNVKAHTTPEFLSHLDKPSLEPRVRFIAPLDQLLWDRTMVGHVFDFDYIWEIYVPEAKRKWGYYVLPVLYGDDLVARIEFWCRQGILEIKRWIPETPDLPVGFYEELERSLRSFAAYCSATKLKPDSSVERRIRDISGSI